MLLKNKGQRSNRGSIETLALILCGAEVGAFRCLLGAHGRGFDSLQLHLQILPASGCNRSRGMSSGMSQGQGWKPAVILALRPEESKGQDDVRELLFSCEPLW